MISELIWAITLIVVLLSAMLLIFLSPFTETVKRYTQMKEKLSSDRKDVEMKKLNILEKNPELFNEISQV